MGPEDDWDDPSELVNHTFFQGQGPPGTEHLWGDYDYEEMEQD